MDGKWSNLEELSQPFKKKKKKMLKYCHTKKHNPSIPPKLQRNIRDLQVDMTKHHRDGYRPNILLHVTEFYFLVLLDC